MTEIRRIAVATFGRSDFSILQPLCAHLTRDPRFDCGLLVGGAHFETTSGRTVEEVEATDLAIWGRIDCGEADRTPLGTSQMMADQLAGFAAAASNDAPDLMLILGDRYEAVAAGLAMVPLGVPVGHISGGSITEGAFDDTFRHCLTKISKVHFCDLPRFAQRIHFMGEPTDLIFTTGALGLDGLATMSPRPFTEFTSEFGLHGLRPGYVLATLHPESGNPTKTGPMTSALLAALKLSGRQVVFTYPNADPGADAIIDAIESAVDGTDFHRVRSFGARWFSTAMAHAGIQVGNSSGGIIEAATFNLPVVDIGDRQKGRTHGPNVIHSARDEAAIITAIEHATSPDFADASSAGNVYGDGRGAERVVQALASLDWQRISDPKHFAEPDLDFDGAVLELV